MLREFEQNLEDNNILHPKKRILVGVSGGVDSVVLLHLLQSIDEEKRPDISVGHINHQLRGESDSDEEFVRKLAASYNTPYYSYCWNKEEHPKSGIEEAARQVRYKFFKELMNEYKATVLMTAHHQDDQVETVLMKLARGSSLEQLTGIKLIQDFNRGQLMRPMLPFTKEQIYEYANRHGIDYVEDASNLSLDYTRNRYRNQIIPSIKQENNQFNEHIEQFIKDIRDILDISKGPINEKFKKLIHMGEDQIAFNYNRFFKLDEPMQRALLKKVLTKLYQETTTQYKTIYIEIIRNWLIEGGVNTQLNLLNNYTVRRNYENVIFRISNKEERVPSADEHFILSEINQWVEISSNEKIGIFEYEGYEDNESLAFQADKIKLPLTIRHRKQGDRMSYKGLSGTKKIKDIFIDEKVSHENRDNAWIVEDADNQILWLISYRKMYLLSDRETDKLAYVIKYQTK